MSLPVVAIVGRPNVGKSSLLNCLAGRRISIVDPTPGVTRDRISFPLCIGEGEDAPYVEVVDTGGIGIVDCHSLEENVEEQIDFGIEDADVILFVVDAREGVQPLDKEVADRLRRLETPVILLANKIDEARLFGEIGELNSLGFGEPHPISAHHARGMHALLDMLRDAVSHLPPAQPEAEGIKLAIIGKRNAGKSTLTNALAGEDRVIVSSTPGTTRDSVDVKLEIDGQRLTLIDTAGVKRNRSLNDDIEWYSQHRALRSVRRADVTAFMIDASLPVSQLDKTLAAVIQEEFKPVIFVINKWDLARDVADPDDYLEYIEREFQQLTFAPILFVSATEGLNVKALVTLAAQVHAQASTRVGTGELNQIVGSIIERRGPSHKAGTKPPKVFYASQVSTNPPTIVLMVNATESFDNNYERFLLNRFHEVMPFSEVPIRLLLRGKGKWSERRGTRLGKGKNPDGEDQQTDE
ncbi:MAG: ribosome biogenesis GTPase Der [Phycisphaerales bacterium]|nr:ribosome biogenesis GTPase Der [Phycisphaerales bacterium]MBT7171751.1 ribosome biogenesis GTPase Der [Phycisphaerales bacterium]